MAATVSPVPSAPAQAPVVSAPTTVVVSAARPEDATTFGGRDVQTVASMPDKKACEAAIAKVMKQREDQLDREFGQFLVIASSVMLFVLGITLAAVSGNPLFLLISGLSWFPPMLDVCLDRSVEVINKPNRA